jgi:hypothetical protein
VRARAHRSGLSLAWDVILAQPWFSHPSAALSRFATLVTCLWYGGVAGDGLRSAEEVTFPIQGRLLYPSHRARRLRAGVSLGTSLGPFGARAGVLGATPALALFATITNRAGVLAERPRPFAIISAGPG